MDRIFYDDYFITLLGEFGNVHHCVILQVGLCNILNIVQIKKKKNEMVPSLPPEENAVILFLLFPTEREFTFRHTKQLSGVMVFKWKTDMHRL